MASSSKKSRKHDRNRDFCKAYRARGQERINHWFRLMSNAARDMLRMFTDTGAANRVYMYKRALSKHGQADAHYIKLARHRLSPEAQARLP